jgi:hypothetical protein
LLLALLWGSIYGFNTYLNCHIGLVPFVASFSLLCFSSRHRSFCKSTQ